MTRIVFTIMIDMEEDILYPLNMSDQKKIIGKINELRKIMPIEVLNYLSEENYWNNNTKIRLDMNIADYLELLLLNIKKRKEYA